MPNTPSQRPGDSKVECEDSQESFETLAEGSDPGILREFVWFLRYNKKWWLTPIIVVLLLLVGLAFVTTSPAAPFIYTLF